MHTKRHHPPTRWFIGFFLVVSTILSVQFVSDVTLAQTANRVDLTIKTKTKHYGITARKFSDVARKMLQRGPRFGGFGRRVWAQAFRQYDWHLNYHRARGKCSVKKAKIRMKITYTLPRLENEKRQSRTFRAKWRRIYRILTKHEHVHGRNYRLLAKRFKAALRKLRPQATCRAVKRAIQSIDDRLHKQDLRRNRRFESRERGRFTRLKRQIERG